MVRRRKSGPVTVTDPDAEAKKLDRTGLRQGEAMGLAVWIQEEAGPYQTLPYPDHSWQAPGSAQRQPPEYHRNGTAELLTLFRPTSGELRANGVRQYTNEVLHPWLKQELSAIRATLPGPEPVTDPQTNRTQWPQWQAGLRQPITLPQELPTLRMLMVLDNLQGHKMPARDCLGHPRKSH